jgi:uncharacterized membrane protein YqiK
MFQTEVVEKIITQILRSVTLFPKIVMIMITIMIIIIIIIMMTIIIIIIIIIIINMQGNRCATGQKTLVRIRTKISSNKSRRQGDYTVESASVN